MCNRQKFLEFVCRHRAPAIAAHWEFLMQPLGPHYSDAKGLLRCRQLEYYRMPMMAFFALDSLSDLSPADNVRLALALAPENGGHAPLSDRHMSDFEARHCYDPLCDGCYGQNRPGTRYMTNGHALVVIGEAGDDPIIHLERGTLGAFRHQHFLYS